MTIFYKFDKMLFRLFVCALVVITQVVCQSQAVIDKEKLDKWVRWCTISQGELEKCHTLSEVLRTARQSPSLYPGIKQLPIFSCTRGIDAFDCMERIQKGSADIITLDAGQGYFAGRYHNLFPIMAEHYSTDVTQPTAFDAVAVVKKASDISLSRLKGSRSCHPNIGDSAGWVYPIGLLMDKGYIEVSECNSPVKAVSNYFNKGMCLPGAINSFYNTFGNNPVEACSLCKGTGDDWCSSGDPYAGYDGAFRCLLDGAGDIAFLRHDTVTMMSDPRSNVTFNIDDYELLCPDDTRRGISEHALCNWGNPQSQIVMASGTKNAEYIKELKKLMTKLSDWFGDGGLHTDVFKLFDSARFIRDRKLNLMFNDATKMLVDVQDRNSYYTWVDEKFRRHLENINRCSQSIVRWCVISMEEKSKCEDMLMSFKARELKPELDCVLGVDTASCMKMIRLDDADLMTLDAADVYYAGLVYNLVPIATEDYGDMTGTFHAVAITHKTNPQLTVFNLKGKRTCQGGVRTGDGFVIPAHLLMETTQIRPSECTLYQNMGELFAQSCIPGVLEREYNRKKSPVNLCESCASGGYRKCQRNSNELYYRSTGAFRCLVENGGDVAFGRHLTVQDNTDGKNRAIWARNRRSDDYELMCKDGSRRAISEWKRCNLGVVPGNAVVTAKHKDQLTRDIYWNVLNYAQMFFSSDSDGDFAMFDSGIIHNDLIFSDACVRLLHVEKERQNYHKYLGVEFEYMVRSLVKYTCDLDEEMIDRYKYSEGSVVSRLSVLTSLLVLLITMLAMR